MRHIDLINARVIKHVLNDEGRRQEQRRDHRRNVVLEGKIRRSYFEKQIVNLKEFVLGNDYGIHGTMTCKMLDIAHLARKSDEVLVDYALGFHCVIVIKVLTNEFFEHLIVVDRSALKVSKHA